GINTQDFIYFAGPAADGVYASASIPVRDEALEQFLVRYAETYGENPPGPYHANAYDATQLILDAVESTATLSNDGSLVVDRAALAAYIRGVRNRQGLVGAINAAGNGELLAAADIAVVRVTDGEYRQVAIGRVRDSSVLFTRMEAP
ncbi:MAG: ABC transporter substrate-binding protein, partial [Anaerolineae bacterium]|nr:ABC transporter substrate-binding protein [Anaerolineae bacterium]